MKNRWWMNLIRYFIDGGGLLCILRPFIHVITGLAKGEMSLTEFYRTAIVLAWLSITWDHCIIRHSLRCFRHSGLVIYMSKLPAPSVSMPCDYRILQSSTKEQVSLVLLWSFARSQQRINKKRQRLKGFNPFSLCRFCNSLVLLHRDRPTTVSQRTGFTCSLVGLCRMR